MEYIGCYQKRRRMHSRPLCEVGDESMDIRKEYEGVEEIMIRNHPDTGWGTRFIDSGSIMGLQTNGIGSDGVERIEVSVSGNYSEEILKKCADRIGEIFERQTVEIPMADLVDRIRKGENIFDEKPEEKKE